MAFFPAVALAVLPEPLGGTKLLLAASRTDFTKDELKLLEKFTRAGGSIITAERADWLKEVQAALVQPAVQLRGAPAVRAIVRDQPRRTIVHLLNLNVQRLGAFADNRATHLRRTESASPCRAYRWLGVSSRSCGARVGIGGQAPGAAAVT